MYIIMVASYVWYEKYYIKKLNLCWHVGEKRSWALTVVLEETTSKTGFKMTEKLNGGSYIQIVDLQHLTSGYENKIWHIVKENTMNWKN
jgi:hypothetical protein